MGAKEAPPQARTRLTRAGIQTAGKTAADRPRRDGGRIKQGDERCGRGWVFSEAHNKTGVLTSHQPGAIRVGNEAGKTTMFRALVQAPSKRDRIPCGIPPPDPATDGRSCLHGHGRRVRRGWLSKSEAVRDCHRLRFGSWAPTGYALYPVESQLFPNPQQFPQMPQWLPGGEL